MTDEFFIKISNDCCMFLKMGDICTHGQHPDYNPWKTPKCELNKCPLKGKYLPLSDEEKEIFEEGHRIEIERMKIIAERFKDFNV